MKKNEITIWTSGTCGHCQNMKTTLEKENIEFNEKINSEHKAEWDNVVKLTGIPTTPTLVINGSYFIPGRDYGTPEQLVEHIKNINLKAKDFPIELKLEEGFKTLIYSVNQGFNRLFQELRQQNQQQNPPQSDIVTPQSNIITPKK